MFENKKILGASPSEYNGIKFRSKLEVSCYKKLEHSKLDFSYETEKIILWKGIKLQKVPVYTPNRGKILTKQTRALLNITYTPDFIVTKGKYKIYFDVKGKENDTYPIKKKMFLKHLEERDDEYTYIFFEPHSVRQMVQAIEIIEKL